MLPNQRETYSDDVVKSKAQAVSMANFMNRVYLWMVMGILVTAFVAEGIVGYFDLIGFIRSDPDRFKAIFFGLIIAQIVAVLGLTFLIRKMNAFFATVVYLLYAALVGVTFSVIFLTYSRENIATAFFLSAFSFAGLSAFGYITKRDLGPIGSFCTIGLFGLIGILFLSLFFPALMGSSIQFAISVCGVIIFAGLTAYDTQKIKNFNVANESEDNVKKAAIYGALTLYLDFINLFLYILRLLGRRR